MARPLRRVWRGLGRQLLRKLSNAVNHIRKWDAKQAAAAAAGKNAPMQFSPQPGVAAALTTIFNQATAQLAARA